MISRKSLLFVLVFAAMLFGGYQITSAATVQVNVGEGGNNFVPASLTINQGDTVVWVWVSGTHNVTSGSCPGGACVPDTKFSSGAPASTPNTFSFTPNAPGTYTYFCSVHLAAMQATIVVNPSGAGTTTPSTTLTPTGQLPSTGSGDAFILLAGGLVLALIIFAARRVRTIRAGS